MRSGSKPQHDMVLAIESSFENLLKAEPRTGMCVIFFKPPTVSRSDFISSWQ